MMLSTSLPQHRACHGTDMQMKKRGVFPPRKAASRQSLTVCNVFSLSGVFNKTNQPARPANAAAVETTPAAHKPVQPRKAVQSVPLQDQPTVQLVMALANLAANPSTSMGAQLAEHHLQVVTTSATCDDMFASALDTFSEDFGVSGDGMAMPMSDIKAAAELLAAKVRGSSFAGDWNPAKSMQEGSFSSTSTNYATAPDRHILEQLMAQEDYNRLSGSGPRSSAEANQLLSRVQALQSQIKQAAATVVSKPSQQQGSKQGGQMPTNIRRAAAASSGAGVAGSTTDEDVYGDAAAMPVLPKVAGSSMPGFATAAAASRARAAAQPDYPVYADPASAWLVVDSTDGRLRHVVIQAPEALTAAVAGARASSDLTTFENYNLGAKINRKLYTEANALYNRFMPLILDHLEQGGPNAKVMLSGSGLGGSLAAVLLLMFVARGMRPSALAPVYTLNAPAVLCEVPDFKQWCSKDGCSMADMDGMMEDLLHRGILSQLGLPQDAIRNIYHQKTAAEAAVQAVNLRGPLQGLAASSKHMVQQFDTAALQQSPLVPDVLKAWLKSEVSGVAADFQRLHILNPVGKLMLYVSAGGSQ